MKRFLKILHSFKPYKLSLKCFKVPNQSQINFKFKIVVWVGWWKERQFKQKYLKCLFSEIYFIDIKTYTTINKIAKTVTIHYF